MKNIENMYIGNQLQRIRINKNLHKRQVAKLLGFKTAGPISSIENGRRTLNLKTALKLAVIYNVPVRAMLDEYYEACREEVKQEARNVPEVDFDTHVFHFCTFERQLISKQVTPAALATIRRHSSDLIRKTAEKMGQL
jgi:transcriptional regulator with XRE-family HTH domain